jgi:ribulose-phosphate 3-epimerase
MIEARNPEVMIQVDGGVTAANVAKIKECGANVFVSGSGVFKGDIKENAAAILANTK